MSKVDLNKHSETDWHKLDAMGDNEIDHSDIPPLGDRFFERATLRAPEHPQVVITIQVDPDVFEWFDAQEDGWENRMRAALRIYAQAHQEQEPIPVP